VKALHFARAAFAGLLFAGSNATLETARAAIPHTFRFATAEEVATLNPDLNTQLAVQYLNQMTAAFAFRYDRDNRIEPELATVIPTQSNGGISTDGKTVTLHLRSGVKWSDGAPFSADDVVFSIAAMNNPANLVPTRQGFDQITRVDEPNPTTVIVHLKAPYGAIVPTLFSSSGGIAILPKHLLGSLHDINNAPYNALPIGIGPFRYAAWKRGDQVELERNPFYWRGQSKLDRLILKLIPDRNTVLTQLQTGELDMWFPFGGSYLSRVQAIPNVHIIRQPSYAINQILFNVSRPVLSDRAVRLALRYAVDRRLLREKVGHGVGLLQNVQVTTVDPSTPKDIAFTPFDLNKANAVLEAAGWKRGADGIRAKNGNRLSIAFVTSSGTPDVDTILELLRTWWNQIGAQMDVRRFESAMLFGPYSAGGILANGRFDAMFLGNSIPAPFDINLMFGCHQFPPAGQNYSHYCNAKFDALADEYDRTYDEGRRDELLSQALHMVDDDVVEIVTTGREDIFGLNNAVKNFTPNSATPFDDMLGVDVTTP
jgi:peptide/nickel transport system substrate-binding protein